jgi:hypothetical protein
VRVVVEGGNLFDLREQALVDLLNVVSGERAGLGGAENGRGDERREQQ